MYTTRRLRLLGQAAREPELMRWSQSIQPVRQKLAPEFHAGGLGVGTVKAAKVAVAAVARPGGPSVVVAQAGAVVTVGAAVQASAEQAAAKLATPAAPTDSIRVICNKCHAAMRVPLAVLRGKTMLNVRCPQCRTVIVLRPKAAPAAGAPAAGSAAPAATTSGAATKPVAAKAANSAATKPAGPTGKTGAGKAAAAPPTHAGGKK
jgi:predicted Zn finger-like uncharacterized protein